MTCPSSTNHRISESMARQALVCHRCNPSQSRSRQMPHLPRPKHRSSLHRNQWLGIGLCPAVALLWPLLGLLLRLRPLESPLLPRIRQLRLLQPLQSVWSRPRRQRQNWLLVCRLSRCSRNRLPLHRSRALLLGRLQRLNLLHHLSPFLRTRSPCSRAADSAHTQSSLQSV